MERFDIVGRKSKQLMGSLAQHELVVALLSGLVVAVLTVVWQSHIDNQRSERESGWEATRAMEADRRENLRFVRERSSNRPTERPFAGIDLQGQTLSGLSLSRANFASADLRGATVTSTNLSGAVLSGAQLQDSNMESAGLTGAFFYHADLSGAHMKEAFMTGALLTGANLSETDLTGAVFVDAMLREANLSGADLTGAQVTGADLRGADLSSADLTGKDPSDLFPGPARIENICHDGQTTWPSGFRPPPVNEQACRDLYPVTAGPGSADEP